MSETGSNPRPVSRQSELHGETVTLTRYRFITPPYGTKKQWQGEWIGNDANRTTGLVEIWAEHMRLIRAALPDDFKPSESPDWIAFPQPVEARLAIQRNNALRIENAYTSV